MKIKTCLIALFLAAVAAAGCAGEPERLGVRRAALSCPIQASTTVVFYGETGASGVEANSRLWVKHFLDWWRAHDPTVVYAELKAAHLTGDCKLTSYPNLRLHIQPGGDAYQQQLTLGAAGKQTINAYLDQGGAYLGICAGFFYASSDYYWKGTYYAHPHLLGRFPTLEGDISAIADFDLFPGYKVTTVSNGHRMLYYGGPTRGLKQTPVGHPGQTLLTYTEVPGKLPAAVRLGKMLLSSVHPEAFENVGITGLTKKERVANYTWLAQTINSVAKTSFKVPGAGPADAGAQDGVELDGAAQPDAQALDTQVTGDAVQADQQPQPPAGDDGGGCSVAGEGASPAWGVLLLALAARRRRRGGR
jgi:MYXO-CTERM domain-containing protein